MNGVNKLRQIGGHIINQHIVSSCSKEQLVVFGEQDRPITGTGYNIQWWGCKLSVLKPVKFTSVCDNSSISIGVGRHMDDIFYLVKRFDYFNTAV